MIKYIHIRPGVTYDSAAKKLVGDPLPKGGTTIAFTYNPATGEIDITVAQCHPRDSYSRARGRQIAGGRLQKGHMDMYCIYDDTKGVVEQVVEQVGDYLDCLRRYFESVKAA